MPRTKFIHKIVYYIAQKAGGLLALADKTSGWADLGNQARVIDTLDRNKIEPI